MEQIARTSGQIGAALRRRRRALNMRQGDLGQKTNLRQATISALENGEPGTQLRTLIEVLSALGLELVIRERSRASEDLEDLY
jgi:HTH-type transcriptional regulator/antitoxin HipB